jgi:hypothetical protein
MKFINNIKINKNITNITSKLISGLLNSKSLKTTLNLMPK